jgi:hypothetical protein
MKKIFICFLVGLTALGPSGCSYLTSRGRQEAAYARYVRRSSAGRVKMQRKLAGFPKIPTAAPVSDAQIATESGPESITASNDSQY